MFIGERLVSCTPRKVFDFEMYANDDSRAASSREKVVLSEARCRLGHGNNMLVQVVLIPQRWTKSASSVPRRTGALHEFAYVNEWGYPS